MTNLDGNRQEILRRSTEAAELDLSDLQAGQKFSIAYSFTQECVDRFAALVGDFSPIHVDEAYARNTEFGGTIVHGMLVASLFSTLVGMKIPGRRALYLGQEVSFRRPVMVGETVDAVAEIASINRDLATVQLKTTVFKADGTIAITGAGKARVRDAATVPRIEKAERTTVREPHSRPVALVTGASRGIGAAIATRLAADGFDVGINYLSNEGRARRVSDAIERNGRVAIPFQADVRDDTAVRAMMDRIMEEFGRLDLLVNNAAPHYDSKPAADWTWSEISEQIDAGVRAPFSLSVAAFPYLRATGGSIVNVLSRLVEAQPLPYHLGYVVGKFGLLGLTRSLAVEWAAEGVRVNGVSPGLIQTDMTSHLKDRVFKLEASRVPLQRVATPEDVAAAVSYLAGRDGAFVTGLILPVTGGQVMK
jgi:3-oxoacyl-[acyl-carrier protein] reductase